MTVAERERERVLAPDPAEQGQLVDLNEGLQRMADHLAALTAPSQPPKTKLVSPDGIEVELPPSAFSALQAIVRDLSRGLTVTVMPHERELTTKEAADILNVSRQFFVRLLERGDIPFHRVGSHRRIRVEDLLAYRDARAATRRDALRSLTQRSQKVRGGYR